MIDPAVKAVKGNDGLFVKIIGHAIISRRKMESADQ